MDKFYLIEAQPIDEVLKNNKYLNYVEHFLNNGVIVIKLIFENVDYKTVLHVCKLKEAIAIFNDKKILV